MKTLDEIINWRIGPKFHFSQINGVAYKFTYKFRSEGSRRRIISLFPQLSQSFSYCPIGRLVSERKNVTAPQHLSGAHSQAAVALFCYNECGGDATT